MKVGGFCVECSSATVLACTVLVAPAFANESRSKRDDGLVIMIYITYSNTYTYDLNNIRYQVLFSAQRCGPQPRLTIYGQYSLRVVEDTKYKIMQPIYNQNMDSRGLCHSA